MGVSAPTGSQKSKVKNQKAKIKHDCCFRAYAQEIAQTPDKVGS
ncbi:hypothetical protein COO91_04140 [Nostoc flagelliforme CCNUN1]|uniref:Uncharacterized protein n=1 Tax=Nostoc flagelliforme CCNUN1 TaxID=2038116 RepID=A0A2K8STQ8_9NOSO|nr:hypothetical protein COO91_04140 [Nostoc flagelliforme CCNUN1]